MMRRILLSLVGLLLTTGAYAQCTPPISQYPTLPGQVEIYCGATLGMVWGFPTGGGGGGGSVTISPGSGIAVNPNPLTNSGTIGLSVIGTNTVMGNVSGGAAAPSPLSATQLTPLINPFSATLPGDVPASGGGTGNFLRADGAWATPPGSGTISGVTAGAGLTGGGTIGTVTLGLASVNPSTLMGNNTIGLNPPTALTGAQATALLSQFNASTQGVVPPSGGVSSNFLRADGIWAVPPGGAGSVSVTAATPDIVVNPSPGTTTFTIGTTQPFRNNTTTTDTISNTDNTLVVQHANTLGVAVTLPQAGTAGFGTGFSYLDLNKGSSGNVTITPTISSINGLTTLTLAPGQFCGLYSDNVNYGALCGVPILGNNQFLGNTSGSSAYPSPLNLSSLAGTGLSFSGSALNFASIANNTVLGNISGGAAAPIALTQTQLTALVNTFTSGVAGDVPASGGGTTNFLRADGSWAAPAGGGNVSGPGSSVNNDLVCWNLTTGTSIKDCGVPIGTSGAAVPRLDQNNTWSKGQAVSPFAMTDGVTITPDASQSNVFTVTLGGNRTLANPTAVIAGQTLIFIITQDATGSRTLAYGTNYKFTGGAAPTLTPAASSVDMLSCLAATTSFLACQMVANLK